MQEDGFPFKSVMFYFIYLCYNRWFVNISSWPWLLIVRQQYMQGWVRVAVSPRAAWAIRQDPVTKKPKAAVAAQSHSACPVCRRPESLLQHHSASINQSASETGNVSFSLSCPHSKRTTVKSVIGLNSIDQYRRLKVRATCPYNDF